MKKAFRGHKDTEEDDFISFSLWQEAEDSGQLLF